MPNLPEPLKLNGHAEECSSLEKRPFWKTVAFAGEQPVRVGASHIEELKDHVSRHRYAPLVVPPRLRREIQSAGDRFNSVLSVEVPAEFADSLNE